MSLIVTSDFSVLVRRGLAALVTRPGKSSGNRGGVPLLPSRGEVVTREHIQQLMDQEDG